MNIQEQVSLFFAEGSSDKEYHLQLEDTPTGFLVNFQYGRRGTALKHGTKTPVPVSYSKAKKIYDDKVAEQLGKGYTKNNSPASHTQATPSTVQVAFIPQLLNPIDEANVERYLWDDSYGAQEKKDGKHQPIYKASGETFVLNKKGQSIGFPMALTRAIKDD